MSQDSRHGHCLYISGVHSQGGSPTNGSLRKDKEGTIFA